MGLWQRFKLIFSSKANKALDKAEDPRETLDYSYEKQLELLQKVRRGVADVATSRKRLELQIQGLAQQEAKLEEQARAALAGGREDLAREALTRRSGLHQQIADLQAQLATLQDQEEKLTVAAQQLQAKVEAFRTKKETIKATYSAAEAQTKINEAFAGHLRRARRRRPGRAAGRGQDRADAGAGGRDRRAASPRARSTDVTSMGKDNITVELERMASENDVERAARGDEARASPRPAPKPEIEG